MKGRLWIQSPLAIMAEGAEGGIVIENGRIVELVAAGRQPASPVDARFYAGRHVVIPGLVNTHHHMFQTLTRAHPAAINKSLWPWISALYPIWARHMT
ncbi:8-oxoguanine deaminase, partial [Rhizobium ruizarguesonis]